MISPGQLPDRALQQLQSSHSETSAHRVVVFGPRWARTRGTHGGGAVVGTGLVVGGVEHVHHGHAEVHPQWVDHEEAKAGEQRQVVARGAACWSYRGMEVEVMLVCSNVASRMFRFYFNNSERTKERKLLLTLYNDLYRTISQNKLFFFFYNMV